MYELDPICCSISATEIESNKSLRAPGPKANDSAPHPDPQSIRIFLDCSGGRWYRWTVPRPTEIVWWSSCRSHWNRKFATNDEKLRKGEWMDDVSSTSQFTFMSSMDLVAMHLIKFLLKHGETVWALAKSNSVHTILGCFLNTSFGILSHSSPAEANCIGNVIFVWHRPQGALRLNSNEFDFIYAGVYPIHVSNPSIDFFASPVLFHYSAVAFYSPTCEASRCPILNCRMKTRHYSQLLFDARLNHTMDFLSPNFINLRVCSNIIGLVSSHLLTSEWRWMLHIPFEMCSHRCSASSGDLVRYASTVLSAASNGVGKTSTV